MMQHAIAIHGGAGTILRVSMTAEKEAAYKAALQEAIDIGDKVLAGGGSALDAVEAAVIAMEDNPLFNAGRGAVFTHDGTHELDASIMCGTTRQAGAVAGVRSVRNPTKLARVIMEKSEHVMLCGMGAAAFALEMGLQFEKEDYFFTDQRFEQLQNSLRNNTIQLDHTEDVPHTSEEIEQMKKDKIGTVGAVAIDVHGRLAAATSTGGMTNKKWGRIGDSPIIGAGTYANNETCAISCTGHGEFFIRAIAAYDISCLMEYKGLSLKEACETVVHNKLLKAGGEGGLVAIDRYGNIELPFNSEGMYRGYKRANGESFLGIYKD
jgi:beta-aspartyl-peptidase (threonine type)